MKGQRHVGFSKACRWQPSSNSPEAACCDALMYVHQRTRKSTHACCCASTLLCLPVQVFAKRRLNDALVRHPAVTFVLDPGHVAAQPAILLSRQPEGKRVRVVL